MRVIKNLVHWKCDFARRSGGGLGIGGWGYFSARKAVG